jgi:hypothetical protein
MVHTKYPRTPKQIYAHLHSITYNVRQLITHSDIMIKFGNFLRRLYYLSQRPLTFLYAAYNTAQQQLKNGLKMYCSIQDVNIITFYKFLHQRLQRNVVYLD